MMTTDPPNPAQPLRTLSFFFLFFLFFFFFFSHISSIEILQQSAMRVRVRLERHMPVLENVLDHSAPAPRTVSSSSSSSSSSSPFFASPYLTMFRPLEPLASFACTFGPGAPVPPASSRRRAARRTRAAAVSSSLRRTSKRGAKASQTQAKPPPATQSSHLLSGSSARKQPADGVLRGHRSCCCSLNVHPTAVVVAGGFGGDHGVVGRRRLHLCRGGFVGRRLLRTPTLDETEDNHADEKQRENGAADDDTNHPRLDARKR